MCFVDVNGIQAIKDLAVECTDAGMTLYLANAKVNIRECLALCGFTKDLGVDHLFLTVHDAVMAIRERNDVRTAVEVFFSL